jgi:FkbM family methyltransferase
MLRRVLSDIVERLPRRLRLSLKARHYARFLAHDLRNRDFDLRGVQLLVRAGQTVLDVGANVGIWTHYLSQLVGPTGCVYSFEPIRETYAILRRNVERFHLGNVIALDRAVSDKDAAVSMSIPRDSRGLRNYHLAQIGQAQNSRSVDVLSLRLDSWFARMGEPRVTFVKIDTEGHELACVHGMLSLVARYLPSLCVEISSDLDDPCSEGSHLESMLKSHHYGTHVWTGTSFRVRIREEQRSNYFFLRDEHLLALELAVPYLDVLGTV